MLLSIVIAAYNAAHSIENTLHSISQLPKENIEVIVINDGSTDNTESILQTFSANNSNIQYINQTNKGVSAARNVGIQMAKGEYIWFVDADDTIEPHNTNILLEKINHQAYDFIWFTNVNVVSGKIEQAHNMPQYIEEGKYNIDQWHNFYKGAGMLWQYWLKREIIIKKDIKFVEWAKWFEDADFLLKFSAQCQNCYISPKILYQYTLNPEGAMRSSSLEDKHKCSVQLSILLLKECKTYNYSTRKFIEGLLAISIAWCIRQANDSYAKELYKACKNAHILPLKSSKGNMKQKIQISILNINYYLYRIFCKIV